MNKAMEYIKSISGKLDPDTLMGSYYQQMQAEAQEISVTSARKVLHPAILQQILEIGIEPKHCYKNATHVAVIDGFDYCEGIAFNKIPFDHAFNSYTDADGKKYYFDFTLEFALEEDVEDTEYALLGEYTLDDIYDVLVKREVYGEIWKYKTLHPNERAEGNKQ